MDPSILVPVVVGGLITTGGTAIINALVTTHARGKTEGVIQEAVKGLSDRVTKAEADIKTLETEQTTMKVDIAAFAGSPRAKAAQAHGR